MMIPTFTHTGSTRLATNHNRPFKPYLLNAVQTNTVANCGFVKNRKFTWPQVRSLKLSRNERYKLATVCLLGAFFNI